MANNGIDILTYAAAKAYADKVAGGGGGSSINVVQEIGFSTEDVMSQAATTKLVYQGGTHPLAIRMGTEYDSAYDNTISIGLMSRVAGQGGITIGANAACTSSSNAPLAIGYNASASADNTVAIGRVASAGASQAVAIGRNATTQGFENSVALGSHSTATRQGEVAVGCSSSYSDGYNNTPYRVIGGVHDGQGIHDAATVAQGNTLATSAPTSSTAGVLGQLYTDTTSMHTYQCTAIDTTDPDNPSYTWTQRW